MNGIKQSVRTLMASPRSTWLWSPLLRGRVCVLTLHRFGDTGATGMHGLDLCLLDDILSRLRRDGYRFVDLHDVFKGARLPSRSVVFTVDDGYADFERGAELFRRHGCPVTVFVTTGFVDRTTWLWWDMIEYCCFRAPAGRYTVNGLAREIDLSGPDPAVRARRVGALWRRCKEVTESEKQRFIRELSAATGVILPPVAPDECSALSWDDIRRLERGGARFAPHTVTHPVLSSVDNDQAKFEIEESWRRLREEVREPTPVLAYPNGQPGDFGVREYRIARDAGLLGAVTSIPEYAPSPPAEALDERYAMPRFGHPGDVDGACLAASGFVRLRRSWR